MAIFAIIQQPSVNTGLQEIIRKEYHNSIYEIDGGHGWLVAANKTAKELSDSLGITEGTTGSALVFEVASYFGRANPNLWTWLKLNWEQRSNA
jgi:hypothetical protein